MQVGTAGQDKPLLWNPGGGYYRFAFRRTGEGWRFTELVMEETWRVALQGSGAGR